MKKSSKTKKVIVPVSKIKRSMLHHLIGLKLSRAEAEFVVNHFLEAEMSGKTTHGIGKFCWEAQFFHHRLGKPVIEVDRQATVLIDARQEIGPLSAKFALDLAIKRSKKYGIALVAMHNTQRYGALYSLTKLLAKQNVIGIVMNTSESLVPHPDGIDKTLGTNPIGISIPTIKEPLLVDMATSKEPMGLTWQALREGVNLPANTFFDATGKYTLDPKLATSVEVFGDYKGYALSLLIQILSTSLLGLPTDVTSPYSIGYVFLAINPAIFVSLPQFKHSTSSLINRISSGKKRGKYIEILLPGETSAKKFKQATLKKTISLPISVWQQLQTYEKH